MHNRNHSLDVLQNDQPHTNEVTYFDTHSADTYEIQNQMYIKEHLTVYPPHYY